MAVKLCYTLMSTLPDPAAPSLAPSVLNEDVVMDAVGFKGRRLLFQALCMKGNCTAAEIVPVGVLKRDATSKQLQELVKAGLAGMKPDKTDARRMRYFLSPGLNPVKFPDEHWELDMGFCVLRWKQQ